MILTILLMVASLIAGIKLKSWSHDYKEEEEHITTVSSSEGEAHPIKFKTVPVTPKEALSLQPTDITRLEYLVGWVNGQLCKLNNEDQSVHLGFPFEQQNRKTTDAVVALFQSQGWNVRMTNTNASRVNFQFSTNEKVRVKLDDVTSKETKPEVDELEQKFVELEKKMGESHGKAK